MIKSIKLINFILILLTAINANAEDKIVINNDDVITKMQAFKGDPNSYIFNYNDKPKEINLNNDNIKSAMQERAYQSEDAALIRDNFDKRAEVKFNDSLLSNSKAVINSSEAIMDGVANEYIDCEKAQDCKVVYSPEIKYCSKEISDKSYKCEQRLEVQVKPPKKTTILVRFELEANTRLGGRFIFDLRSQKLLYNSEVGEGTVLTRQDNTISAMSCNNFNMKIINEGFLNLYTDQVIKAISLDGDCNTPKINITIEQRHADNKKHRNHQRGIYAIIEFSSLNLPVITDSLTNSCPEIEKRIKAGLCTVVSSQCLAPNETRMINSTAVTRNCWQQITKYSCGANKTNHSINTCQHYEDKNCLQVSSDCSEYIEGICVKVNNGYKCPTNQCSGKLAASCADGQKINEMIAEYTIPATKEDSGFANNTSKLAVINEAIKNNPGSFTADSPFIFKGKMMKCQKSAFGFKNCCKDNGWGIDLNLAKCSEAEKELGVKKQNGLAIYVGTYKSNQGRITHKTYCVFPSKIAKIIQEKGRLKQLNIGFGEVKYPDCRAISPIELSKINLDKIDLSSAFGDVTNKQQNLRVDKEQEKLQARIKQYYTDEVVNG